MAPRKRKAKPKPRGRPTELERAQPIILRELRASGTMTMAAAAAGISLDTLLEWVQRGNATHPKRGPTPAFVRFAQALEAAVAEGKRKRIRIITRSKDWRAHAWMLERGHAAEFGRIDRLKAETTIGGDASKPPIRVADMPQGVLEQLLGTLAEYSTTPKPEMDALEGAEEDGDATDPHAG